MPPSPAFYALLIHSSSHAVDTASAPSYKVGYCCTRNRGADFGHINLRKWHGLVVSTTQKSWQITDKVRSVSTHKVRLKPVVSFLVIGRVQHICLL